MAALTSAHNTCDTSAGPDCRATASPSSAGQPWTIEMAAPTTDGVRLMHAPQ